MVKRSEIPNIERRNTFIIYIREADKPIVKRFLRYIIKDERIDQVRFGHKMGVMSVAIAQLITSYVDKAENLEIPGITQDYIDKVVNQVPDAEDSSQVEINEIEDKNE